MKEHEPFSGRYWGVFNVEGDGEPIVMFASREDAAAYLAARQASHVDDDDHLDEHCQVFRVDCLGVWWNSYDPDPHATSPLAAQEIVAEYNS